MRRPLDGIRVIELGRTEAVGLAGLMLSDFGAEVILIDPPETALTNEEISNEDSITFGVVSHTQRLCDRGKKRVFLDLADEGQRGLFLKLLRSADALLDGLKPDEERYGITEEFMAENFRNLTYVSVSGYGASGPYAGRPASEGTIQAESGFMSTTGAENGDPVRSGGDMANFLGGMIGCIAALMSLAEKARNQAAGKPARGRQVDVSMMDSILYGLENQFSLYLKSGRIPKPRGNRYALSAPVGNFPCRDGEIMISVATETQWKAFAETLGHPEWLEKPEYINVSHRLENYKILGEDVARAFSGHTKAELMELLQKRSCIYGCINDFSQVVDHPQTAARKMFMEAEGPGGERIKAPANPILIDGKRMQSARSARPGEDTAGILGRL